MKSRRRKHLQPILERDLDVHLDSDDHQDSPYDPVAAVLWGVEVVGADFVSDAGINSLPAPDRVMVIWRLNTHRND